MKFHPLFFDTQLFIIFVSDLMVLSSEKYTQLQVAAHFQQQLKSVDPTGTYS